MVNIGRLEKANSSLGGEGFHALQGRDTAY
jgi:hypothetical protein